MPAKPTDLERVSHMIRSINKIFAYTKDLDAKSFCENELVKDAVEKNFEVIGEAAYHITPELKKAWSKIEWKKIQGMRHVLVHDYYKVNPKILWNTKVEFLPILLFDLEDLMETENKSQS
ncbi:MAG: HepT-like ribonuclease domain-containing protein [Bacteroidota bacterium]